MGQVETEKFIELYKELEEIAANRYSETSTQSVSLVVRLANEPQHTAYRSKLNYCRKVRNLLSHSVKIQNDFAVEPSPKMVGFLNTLITELKNPTKAYDVAIKEKRIFHASIDDYVLPIMKQMQIHTYTHVPILENEIITGVFSENTLFQFLLENEIVEITERTTVREFEEHLPINNHITEAFKYITRRCLLFDVNQMFENAYSNTERLSMLFITENGLPSEKLLGVITPWDVLGKAQ